MRSITYHDSGVDRVVDGSGALRDALTLLEEKRATTRERALRDALKLLRRRPVS